MQEYQLSPSAQQTEIDHDVETPNQHRSNQSDDSTDTFGHNKEEKASELGDVEGSETKIPDRLPPVARNPLQFLRDSNNLHL